MALPFESTSDSLFNEDANNLGYIRPSGNTDYLSSFATADFSNDIYRNRARQHETGTALDALAGLAAGGISGMSFGLFRPDFGYSEEEKTMAFRMGEGAGHMASIVAPMGPFAALGKLGNLGVKGLSKGSRALASKAATTTAAKFANKGLSKQVLEKELKDQLFKNDATKAYLTRHGINAQELATSNKFLQQNLSSSLKASFKKTGQKVDDRLINRISRNVADELRKPGVHVNTIEDWVHRAVGGRLPDFAGKYLGMAVQDFYMFSMYGLVTSGVGAMVHNDELDFEGLPKAIGTNLVLSGIFPGIRAIPGGGKYTLKQGAELFKTRTGLSTFRNNFRRTDYKDLVSTKHGEQDARGLVTMMMRGSDTNTRNVSIFKGHNYKVKDAQGKIKSIGPEEILLSIGDPKKLPKTQVVQILEQMRGISDKAFGKWGKGYLNELVNPRKGAAFQLARMILGSLAMNYELFTGETPAFEYMETPELFQHLAIGAMMTKSRGLWAKDNVTSWSRDFSNYQEIARKLNLDHSQLTEMVGAYNQNVRIGESFGLSARNSTIGSGIYDAVYKQPGKNEQIHTDVADGKVDAFKVERVNEVLQLAQTMRAGTNPNEKGEAIIDVRRLSKARIEELYESFNAIELPDGTPISGMSMPDMASYLSINQGKNIGDFMTRYLHEVSKEIGLPIVVKEKDGKFTGDIDVYPIELPSNMDFSANGNYEHNLVRLKDWVNNLSLNGLATKRANAEMKQKFIVTDDNKIIREGAPDVDVGKKLEEITERYMSYISKQVIGNDAVYFDFLDPYNSYMKTWLSGKAAEVRERAYKLSRGETTGEALFKEAEQNFIQATDYAFKVSQDVTPNLVPGDSNIGLMSSKPPKIVANKDASKKQTEDAEYQKTIENTQLKINNIYDVMRSGYTGKFDQSKSRNQLELRDAEQLVVMEQALGLNRSADPLYEFGYRTDLASYVARRSLANAGFNSESLAMAVAARENGFFDLEKKVILSPDAVADALQTNNIMSETDPKFKSIMNKYKFIYNKLSKHPSIQDKQDLPLGESNELIDPKAIEAIYNVSTKGLSQKAYDDLVKTIDKINRSAKDEELAELGAELTRITEDLTTYLDGITNMGAQSGDVPITEALVKHQEGFVKILQEVNNKVGGLEVVETAIKDITAEMLMIQKVYNDNPAMAGENKYNPETLLTIGEKMQDIINAEQRSQLELTNNLERLASLRNSHLHASELMRYKDLIMKQISTDLGRPDILTTMSINEAIAEYTKNRSFESLNNVVKSVISVAAKKQTWNQLQRDVKDNVTKLEDIIKDNTAHNRNDTPMKIIKRFNLQDLEDVNKIDFELVELLDNQINNPTGGSREALEQFLVDRLSEKYGKPGTKDYNDAYGDLMVQWPVLQKQFASLNDITTEYSINETNLEYNNETPMRKTLIGPASDFIKVFNFEGLGFINDNIVQNGTKKLLKDYSKDELQNLVDKSLVIDVNLAEKINKAPADDAEMIIDRSQRTEDGRRESNFRFDTRNKMILDMHAGNPLLIPVTEANLNSINDQFNLWYENKLERLKLHSTIDVERNFIRSTEGLVAKEGTDASAIKMHLMSLDVINSAGFDKIFASDTYPITDAARQNYHVLADKLLKVSKQADNTNYVKFTNNDLLALGGKREVDVDIRNSSLKFEQNNVKILTLSDEAMGQLKDSPDYVTSSRRQVFETYDQVIGGYEIVNGQRKEKLYSKDEIDAAIESKAEIENRAAESSLVSSLMDGNAIIVDHDFTMFNGAIHGDKNSNGFKNNISYSADFLGDPGAHQGTITKMYMHENPHITGDSRIKNWADKSGTTIILGESSAKALYGLDVNGNQIRPYELDNSKSFLENLRNIPENNINGVIEIPFEAIGFGYAAKPGEKVIIPHSITDFMTPPQIQKTRIYQGLAQNIDKLTDFKGGFVKLDAEQQALTLMQSAVDETGYDFTGGEYGFAELALKTGMISHHNPIVRKAVMGLFNGKVFDTIRRPLTEAGADSYTVPDMLGDHKAPKFRSIYTDIPKGSGTDAKNQEVFRVMHNLGETSPTYRVGQTPVRTMEDMQFVANFNGRDIIFTYDGKSLNIIDHLSKMAKTHQGKDYYLGGNVTDKKKLSDYSLPKSVKNDLSTFVRAIEKDILNNPNIDISSLNLQGMLNILKHGRYRVKDKDGKLSTFNVSKGIIGKTVLKYDIGLGTATLAIPKKSYDLGYNRIKSFLHQDWGNHSILNNHDLRIMHQRDWDGDHLYHYTSMPFDNLKSYVIPRLGVVKEYDILARTPHESNVLGIDYKTGAVGAINSEVGMTNLKQKVFAGQYNIGETISLKNIINDAANLGIKFNHKGSEKSEFRHLGAIDGINKDFTSNTFKALNVMTQINQNQVDYWGGKHAASTMAKDLILNGDVPKHVQDQLPFEIEGAISNSGPFKQRANMQEGEGLTESVKANVNRNIRDIVINVLKRPNVVFNNPYNEGGQFTPTDWYLKNVYNDLKSFLTAPNEYVVGRLFSKYRGRNDVLGEIYEMFYVKSGEQVTETNLNDFIQRLGKSNKIPAPRNKVVEIGQAVLSKKTGKTGNVVQLMEMSNSSYLLNEMNKRGLIRDVDYYGDMLEHNKDMTLADIIPMTGNLVQKVMMYKAYFPNVDPSSRVSETYKDDLDYFDMGQPIRDPKKKTKKWSDIEVRSVASHLLEKDASRLRVELSKMSGQPNRVNEYDKGVLEQKLGDIESTLKVLDKLSINSVFDKSNLTGGTKQSNIITQFYKRGGKQTNYGKAYHLYKIKGRYINPDEITNLNFKQLEFVGRIDNGKTADFYKGNTYIKVNKFLQRRYIGDNESLHALGLYDYINQTTNINQIIPREKQSAFYNDLYELHKTVNEDYHLIRRALKEEPAQKTKAFEWSSRRDLMAVEKFLDTWNPKKENMSDTEQSISVDKDVNLIKLAILPRHADGQYVEINNHHLPYLYMNTNLQKATMQYLKSRELIDIDPSTGIADLPGDLGKMFEHQRIYVKNSQGIGLDDAALDKIAKHRKSAMSSSYSDFYRHGELSAPIEYMFMDWGYVDPAVMLRTPETRYNGEVYTVESTNALGKKSKAIYKRRKRRRDRDCVNN